MYRRSPPADPSEVTSSSCRFSVTCAPCTQIAQEFGVGIALPWTYNIELTLAIPLHSTKFDHFCFTRSDVWSSQLKSLKRVHSSPGENKWYFFRFLVAKPIILDFGRLSIARHHIWDFAENWLQLFAKIPWFFADKNSDFYHHLPVDKTIGLYSQGRRNDPKITKNVLTPLRRVSP